MKQIESRLLNCCVVLKSNVLNTNCLEANALFYTSLFFSLSEFKAFNINTDCEEYRHMNLGKMGALDFV